jgi:Flp pilus assembly protein TadB
MEWERVKNFLFLPREFHIKRFLKIDWAAAVLLWVGNYFLIYQRSWVAFVIFFVANGLWFVHWYKKREWAAMILVFTFLLQNILGVIAWR